MKVIVCSLLAMSAAGCLFVPVDEPYNTSTSANPAGAQPTLDAGTAVDAGTVVDAGVGPRQCPLPKPSGCEVDADCLSGNACVLNTRGLCVPSACACDSVTGTWNCTNDCDGRICQPTICSAPNPQGCRADAECGPGEQCVDHNSNECIATYCFCDATTKSWVCTEDCGGKKCAASACTTPTPQGCTANSDCGNGRVCVESTVDRCIPTSCSCDAASKSWLCTADCSGKVCEQAIK